MTSELNKKAIVKLASDPELRGKILINLRKQADNARELVRTSEKMADLIDAIAIAPEFFLKNPEASVSYRVMETGASSSRRPWVSYHVKLIAREGDKVVDTLKLPLTRFPKGYWPGGARYDTYLRSETAKARAQAKRARQ